MAKYVLIGSRKFKDEFLKVKKVLESKGHDVIFDCNILNDKVNCDQESPNSYFTNLVIRWTDHYIVIVGKHGEDERYVDAKTKEYIGLGKSWGNQPVYHKVGDKLPQSVSYPLNEYFI